MFTFRVQEIPPISPGKLFPVLSIGPETDIIRVHAGVVKPSLESMAQSLKLQNTSLQSTDSRTHRRYDCTASKLSAHVISPVSRVAQSTVIVSDQNLSQYILAPTAETPIERFIREENAVQMLSSCPWVARLSKL